MKAVVKKKVLKTSMGTYIVNFEANTPQRGYTITVPSLKGIVTFGDTMKEAEANAVEAIELHCKCLLQAGSADVRPKVALKQIA